MIEYNIDVNFENRTITPNEFYLVSNDYNSVKFKFNIDKTGNEIIFKIMSPNNKVYVDEIVNGEIILDKGILSEKGIYQAEIAIYGADSKLTNYGILKLYVRGEVVDSNLATEPDITSPILDELVTEMQNTIDDLNNKVASGYFNGDDGKPGRDGYKQYTAGENINITNDVISSSIDLSNYYTKSETTALIEAAIGDALEGDY